MKKMEGYYDKEYSGKQSKVPTGRLSIQITNLPEFNELIKQAEKESSKLQKTINQLKYFELNIDFSSEPISRSESVPELFPD